METRYKSTFKFESPPQLMMVGEMVFDQDLDEIALAGLEASFGEEGFLFFEDHKYPRVCFDSDDEEESSPIVVQSIKVYLSENKKRVVALSKREVWVLTTEAEFSTVLPLFEIVESVLSQLNPRISELNLQLVNAFEVDGLTTDLIIPEMQGPSPTTAHEHRLFSLASEIGGDWFTLGCRYLHGDQYKPNIRDRHGPGLGHFLSLAPGFDSKRKTNCYEIFLEAKSECSEFDNFTDKLIDFKHKLNSLFLRAITPKAKEKWQYKKIQS